MLYSQPGALILNDGIEKCRANSCCKAINFETVHRGRRSRTSPSCRGAELGCHRGARQLRPARVLVTNVTWCYVVVDSIFISYDTHIRYLAAPVSLAEVMSEEMADHLQKKEAWGQNKKEAAASTGICYLVLCY